jgi:hypothetical protein
LFGSEVRPDRVIGETLVRATTEASASTEELSASIRRDPPSTADDFLKDALAAWVESTFGVAAAPETGGLVRQRPTTVAEAGVRLSAQTGIEEQMCIGAIQRALLVGSRLVAAHRRPIFAFRLHQFLSKGDTVYASLEPEADRYLTDRYQLRVPGSPESVLLPLGFCRECGQEYYVVAKSTVAGREAFVPRHDADASGGTVDETEQAVAGVLHRLRPQAVDQCSRLRSAEQSIGGALGDPGHGGGFGHRSAPAHERRSETLCAAKVSHHPPR